MQRKVEKEAEEEKELFDKFMCYCKTGRGDLEQSIAAAEEKLPTLEAALKAESEEKTQTDEAIKQAKVDRADAKTAMAEATSLREKDAAEFAKVKADSTANIGSVAKSVDALKKGLGGAFLQTEDGAALKAVVNRHKDLLSDDDGDTVISFLSGTEDSQYAPASGDITGILKQMGDEMETNLADAVAVENKAIEDYRELMAAKTKEVDALTRQIEAKMQRSGELAVSIAQAANDIEDTKQALAQDKSFLAELDKSCGTKAAEWEERCKVRQEELVALADTIKILNDDDALEMFKKTLPSSSAASFLQVQVSQDDVRNQARSVLKAARRAGHGTLAGFVAQALHGRKGGFEKVTAMIDEMINTLRTEQKEDDSKKQYCGTKLDEADDKRKATERSIKDSEAAIEAAKEGIATSTEEIAALIDGIHKLDKSVADATEQRQEENTEYKSLMANNGVAKELLKMAQNRLNKFYNPKLYKAPAKKERSSVDAIAEDVGGASFVQVDAQDQDQDLEEGAPPPPPETFGAYQKQTQMQGGVTQMINLLMTDLEKDMVEAETEEKDAQGDYEVLMQDAAAKRASDSKSLAQKESTKAELEMDLQAHQESLRASKKDLASVLKYNMALHTECDWLLKFFDVRKEMRANEVDALGKAKAVLAGADYS
jgi:chromosome segregation ATPase